MHDYFDILGVPRNARPMEIRRVCRQRARATHPDVWDGAPAAAARACAPTPDARARRELFDAAVDFLDAGTFVDAMRAAFFAPASRVRS